MLNKQIHNNNNKKIPTIKCIFQWIVVTCKQQEQLLFDINIPIALIIKISGNISKEIQSDSFNSQNSNKGNIFVAKH